MSKNHRGSGIRSLPAHGRGTCAICGKTDIKVLWEKEINGQTVNVCKYCNAKLKNEYLKAHADSQNFQKRINDQAIKDKEIMLEEMRKQILAEELEKLRNKNKNN